LAKSEIRIRYSGLIIFAAQIISVATGTAFILLLTRSMTTQQYGVWSNIFDLTAYFLIFSGLVPFWATRFVARAKEGATKTALLANFIVAIGLAAIYIPIVPVIMGSLHISETYIPVYVLASTQIITVYMIAVLESCLRAEKPQAIGYGLLIEEVCKLGLAYLFIVEFQQIFLGAMLSLVLSASFEALFYLKLLSKDLGERIQWSYVREWLKGSIAILYNTVGGQLTAFMYILLLIYGGQAGRADFQAAATFAGIIGYSLSLAFALYPKLLAENSLKEITTSLRTVLMFAFPLVAIVISMSQSLLTVLNISYRTASPVLILLSIDALISLISQFYTSVLYGVERLDEEAKIPLGKLIRSKMFKLLTLPYVQAAITLPTALYVLSQFANGQPVQAAVYAATIVMAAHVAMFLLTYLIMRTSVRIAVPWRSVGKYLVTSAVTAAILYALPHPETLALTFATVVAGAVIYAALLLAIDRDARTLLHLILQEIGLGSKTKGSSHDVSQEAEK
jgi:O-antigen/teichoic acid export membrane protein